MIFLLIANKYIHAYNGSSHCPLSLQMFVKFIFEFVIFGYKNTKFIVEDCKNF